MNATARLRARKRDLARLEREITHSCSCSLWRTVGAGVIVARRARRAAHQIAVDHFLVPRATAGQWCEASVLIQRTVLLMLFGPGGELLWVIDEWACADAAEPPGRLGGRAVRGDGVLRSGFLGLVRG